MCLFGNVNPGGKLPVTFPRHVGRSRCSIIRKSSGGKSNWYLNYVSVDSGPLYPFGHGLSYTTFAYSDFSLSPKKIAAGGILDVSLNIRNTGTMAGDEVVQLYACDEYGCVPRPVKELKGFVRISLQPTKPGASPSTCQ